MPGIWTELTESQLIATADLLGSEATAKQIADEFAKVTGFTITSDQASSKLRRIREGTSSPVLTQDQRQFIRTPMTGEYVGPRVAFWDIEATDLKTSFGRLLCSSVADSWGNVTTFRHTDFPQVNLIDDSGIAAAIRDDLERYDIIIGFNSVDYDIRFLTGRLLHAGLRPVRPMMHTDIMWQFNKLRPGRRSLEAASIFFRTEETKTPLVAETWALAGAGDRNALEEVVEHNIADVLTTRAVYAHVKPVIIRYTRA